MGVYPPFLPPPPAKFPPRLQSGNGALRFVNLGVGDMVALATDAFAGEPPPKQQLRIDWALVACIFGAVAFVATERIRRAADFLLERDNIGADPHHQLSAKAAARETTPDEIDAILNEIENAGSHRNIYQLALARRRLLPRRVMQDVRRRIVTLIARDLDLADRVERTARLLEALVGEQRESYQTARRVALDALAVDTGINLRIRNALEQVAAHDGARALQKEAAEILARYPETPD